MHTHIHTQAPVLMSVLTVQNLVYTQLKMGSKQRLETVISSINLCRR